MNKNQKILITQARSSIELDKVKNFICENYQLIFQESRKSLKLNKNKFNNQLLKKQSSEQTQIFMATINNKIIGTLTIYTNNEFLPIEEEQPICLTPFRINQIKVCEIGRFSIHRDFRFNPFIAFMLFMKVFDYCISKKTYCVVTQAFNHTVDMLKRFGMKNFYSDNTGFKDKEFGVICYPLYLDIKNKFEQILSRYDSKNIFTSQINIEKLENFIETASLELDIHNVALQCRI